ncbi:MAG: TrkA family potassium uptake protein [Candidatus Aenigmarchaeota archaeon]|nr:TrkA family potassium uptake protein [Candidatus Aenigmarchaeota archaeon]
MYIIIVGIDPVSIKLIEKLSKKHDVVVIDADEKKCEEIYTNTGVTVINDDATKLDVLQDAGITKAAVVFSTLENDNKNIIISMIAKKFGVPKVVSRLENDEFEGVYKMLDVAAIEYNDILFSEFYLTVEHPKTAKIIPITKNIFLFELNILRHSKIRNMRIDELKELKKFPKGIVFCSLLRKDELFDIKHDTRILEGDVIFIMCSPAAKKLLEKVI